jgi:hypothetical protein
MANRNPSPATRIKKGERRNPLGGKLHNPAIRALKNLTIATYREVIELALTSNIEALKRVAENPNTPAVQVGVATALIKAIAKGDWNIVNAIAERIVGKIPDKVEVTNKVESNVVIETYRNGSEAENKN